MPGHISPGSQPQQRAIERMHFQQRTREADAAQAQQRHNAMQAAPTHADGGHVAWKHDDNQVKASGAHTGKLHEALEKFSHHHDHAGHGDLGHAFEQLFHHHTGAGDAIKEVAKHVEPQAHHAHVE